VVEAHAGADLDQPGRLGRRRRAGSDAELLGCAPEHGHVTDRLGRRGQQQRLRLRRKRFGPPQKALLDATRQRPWLGKPEAARQLRRRQAIRSSSSASGLPRASATIRSRIRSSSRPGIPDASN